MSKYLVPGNRQLYVDDAGDVIINSGNVGIGIDLPQTKFHIQKDQNTNTNFIIKNENTGTLATARILLSNDTNVETAAGLILGGVNYSGVSGWDDRFIFNAGANISNGLLMRAAAGGVGVSASGGTAADHFFDTNGDVGIGVISSLSGQLHVDQKSTTGAQPVLYLDQGDVSEEIIHFECTIGTGNGIEAVAAKTLTPTHFIKCTITGALTKYFQVGDIA